MARPSGFDRSEAVETAMNEIWKNGYEKCSVKALSEKLGITRSSFYNAFGSREALFGEVLQLYSSRSPDISLANVPPDTSVKKLFTRTFRAACKARANDTDGRGCLAINCVAELCNVDEKLGPVLEKAVLGSLAQMEALLEQGVVQGEIDRQTDLHATALALQNLLMGLNVMCKVVRNESELWQAAKTTLKGLDIYQSQ